MSNDAPFEEELETIVTKLQQGIEVDENFRRIFNHYYSPVFQFFSRRGFSPEECLDLIQEAFLRTFVGIGSYRGDSSFSTWLYGMLANVYRVELRRRHVLKRAGKEVALDDEVAARTAAAGGESEILSREAVDLVAKAVAELPPQMRRVLMLRSYHGHGYQEIADLLGLSIETVKSHLFQARRRLRQDLGSSIIGDAEEERTGPTAEGERTRPTPRRE